jgi:thiosulfate/3-mercaptopyruvate sulfurtransferase
MRAAAMTRHYAEAIALRLTGPMSALVDAAGLRRELSRAVPPVLVDVQWTLGGPPGRDAYRREHLRGAHFVDVDAELSGAPGPGGRHPLPTAWSVEQALRRCGVDHGSAVVVYDQGPGWAAARAWWVFRYYGLRDVRVLDGGLAAWRAADGSVTDDVPDPGCGSFRAMAGGMPLLDADGAAKVARTGILLDARSPERYAGTVEPVDPVAGHIPGAVSAPAAAVSRAEGGLRAVPELRRRLRALGVRAGTPVGTYCGSGVSAAHLALALHEIGVEAPVYVGSWSGWITDPSRPVATGPEPG